ncbi:unnamed protein product, partial [Meganyctiphanes norvegica]
YKMKTLLVILSLAVLAHADGDHGHDHHGDHHAAPASSYSDLPPADPHTHHQPAAPTHHQPAAPTYNAPAAPTYQQPAAPVDNGYYYYYYPVEEKKKEKDFFGKIKDEYDSFKLKATNFDIKAIDTKKIVIIALIVVGLILLGPAIANLLGLGVVIQAIIDWITNLIAANGGGRDIEINIDDVMRYATTVYKAINKKY